MLHTIQPNFTIPKGFERLFLMQEGDCQHVIIADEEGVHFGHRGPEPGPGNLSRSLDWIQECIESVRAEVEGVC